MIRSRSGSEVAYNQAPNLAVRISIFCAGGHQNEEAKNRLGNDTFDPVAMREALENVMEPNFEQLYQAHQQQMSK